MSTLLPYPRFKAIDAAGVPYSGGKVYTYRAGTSTAKATYSDMACATPNANPVVLDSAGEATLYLKGKYKIVLKTSADVPVWTLDNVQGMGDWEESAFYPDYNETDQGAAGSGASMKDLIDWIASENATLILAHNSGSTTTTYTLSTSETIPSNISLKVQKGAKISIGAGKTLTINGNIDAGDWEIFTGTGTVAGSPLNAIMLSAWFNAGLTNSTNPSGALKSIVASGAQGDIFYHNGTSVVRLAAVLSGDMLVSGGSGGNPSWSTLKTTLANRIQVIRKTADQIVNNSATTVNDTDLKFPIESDGIWAFELWLQINSGSTPDFKIAFAVPASALAEFQVSGDMGKAGTGDTPVAILNDLAAVAVSGRATEDFVVMVRGKVVAGGTAGNVQFKWAQNTANASDSIVRANSHFICHKLN